MGGRTVWAVSIVLVVWCLTGSVNPCWAASGYSQPTSPTQFLSTTLPPHSEPLANTTALPGQILKTGINLSSKEVSANTLQLSENLKLTPLLRKIQELRSRQSASDSARPTSIEGLSARQEIIETTLQADHIIQTTSLAIDFTVAQIVAEENVYGELLASFTDDRDKAVAKTNAASFVTNGILWAVAEGLAVPTYRVPRYSISSGITGVLAGLVPSVASLYAMKQFSGKKRTSEKDPNMLAKLFDYPTSSEVEYPNVVWDFLNTVPANDKSGRTRKSQLIDRWVADENISAFTSRSSTKQLDVITAAVETRKGLSIANLSVRQVMLEQLAAEILKMKRMLYELSLVLDGEKQI